MGPGIGLGRGTAERLQPAGGPERRAVGIPTSIVASASKLWFWQPDSSSSSSRQNEACVGDRSATALNYARYIRRLPRPLALLARWPANIWPAEKRSDGGIRASNAHHANRTTS
jgi:hypothetical protein